MERCFRRPAGVLLLSIVAGLMLPVAVAQARMQQAAVETGGPVFDAPVIFDTGEIGGEPVRVEAARQWHAGQFDGVLALIRPLAESGDRQAQFVLGGLYSQGQGVPQDEEQAAWWWRKAAEQGLARAQNEIAVMLSDGLGVPADPRQAIIWYRKAADQGLAVAQTNLGLMYWRGVGVRRNDKQAVAWFRQAAEQEFGWAQFYLGVAHAEGRGVARNERLAVGWFREAAEQGYTEAENALGMMYFRGKGVARSVASAAYWFSRAARSGLAKAEQNMHLMLPRLARRRLNAVTEVREQPDVAAAVIRTATDGESAYELDRRKGWVAVYLVAGNTVGYVRAAELGTY